MDAANDIPDSAITTNRHLKGKSLWMLRGVWIILAVIILAVNLKALSVFFEDRLTPCEGFCPAGYLWQQEVQDLSSIGLSAELNAWYFFIIDTLPVVLALFGMGLLLAWLRSDDWVALYTSLFLLALTILKLPIFFNPPWVLPLEAGIGIFAISSAPILMYIFPNGRFVPRWSFLLVVPVIAWMTYQVLLPDNPWYVLAVSMAFHLSGIGSLVYRYKHISNATEKRQIKWVVWVFSIRPICEVGIRGILFPLLLPITQTPGLVRVFFHMFTIPIFSTLPFIFTAAGLGVAIFRYRLWDIDFVINRSLVYGVLTALLIALFSVSLLAINLLSKNFANAQLMALVISAAVFGAIFQPARRRLQRYIDRHFYNINIDYQKTPPFTSHTDIIKQTDFGKYQNLELIGVGGMAKVYRSTHPTLGTPVAIKILPEHLISDNEFQKRFMREAETVSKLEHPNIIRVFDYGEEQGVHYIIMEYLSGKDLSLFLKTGGKLTLDQALPIIRQIATALDYAHSRGFVHRDIKPSNVMLETTSPASRVVLTDFGLVKIMNSQTGVTGSGVMLGTMDYIAPEQIQAAAEVDGKADIYSLGIMVYQMLTGELPYKYNNPGALLIAHMTQPPPDAPGLPEHVSFAIKRAMAKSADERFASAMDLFMEMSREI